MDNATVADRPSAPRARKKKRTGLPTCVVTAMTEINHATQKVRALVPIATQVAEILADFEDVLPCLTIHVGTDYLSLACYPKAMSRIVELMRAIRRTGCAGTGKMDENGYFTVDMGQVKICAYFGTGAENKCVRVQVGVREVPVYEVRCKTPEEVAAEVVSAPEVTVTHAITTNDEPPF